MKHFSATLLIALTCSAPASAFSMDLNLPNLTYPATGTTISTQSCVSSQALPCK